MGQKRTEYSDYATHGRGLSSLTAGFDEIGMPAPNRRAAIDIVKEVLAANGLTEFEFSWYMTPGKKEICGSWDGAERNLLWINSGELHVWNAPASVVLPKRSVTYRPENQRVVGWLLPQTKAGASDGSRKPLIKVTTVLCPEQFIEVPAGRECSYCDVVHPA